MAVLDLLLAKWRPAVDQQVRESKQNLQNVRGRKMSKGENYIEIINTNVLQYVHDLYYIILI